VTTTIDKPARVLVVLRQTPTPVRYLLGGVLVNQLGAFVQTFMVLYLVFRGFSAGQAGGAIAAYSVGSVLGVLLGGELAHRIGPRATIAAAMLGSATILAVVPAFSRPALFDPLILLLLLAGLATQSYRPAAAVLLSDLMPGDLRVMGFSMMRIALNLGAALSPLIAAGLILVDWNLLLWFDAATALLYAILARWLLPDMRVDRAAPDAARRTTPGAAPGPTLGARAAYRILFRDGRFWLFLGSVLLGTVIYVQYTTVLPLKISSEGHSTGLYSAVLVTASAALILCELKITTYVVRWPGHVPAAAGTVLMGLGVAGFGVSGGSAAALIVCTVVFVFGIMINGPTMFAYPATFPAVVKARYVSAHQATFGLGMAVGPVFGVAAWTGLGNGVWWLCGGLGLVAAFCAHLGMKAPGHHPSKSTVEKGSHMVEIRNLDRSNLTKAYGLDSQRLLPWPALNAPFEGAWCVLRAGDESTPHSHHEYEVFIAMTGSAVLDVDGWRHDFVAGDIVHLTPGSTHKIVNDGPNDFEYYGIWWDADMSTTFLARHQARS
jgi:MFS family permease/mannose-6-phosphate isomerase-like protein (cupin superfamily)